MFLTWIVTKTSLPRMSEPRSTDHPNLREEAKILSMHTKKYLLMHMNELFFLVIILYILLNHLFICMYMI